MKQEARVALMLLIIAAPSCSLLFGDRGGIADPVDAPALTTSFRRVPDWVRPTAKDYARSEALRAAIARIERGESLGAAIDLQTLRSQDRWGPEVTALHAWALVDAGSAQDARRVALDGLTEHGEQQPALNYSLGVAAEVLARPVEALAAYRRVLQRDPTDPVLLRACARTAIAAKNYEEALLHLDRLAASGVQVPEGMEWRATALAGAGRHAEAVALQEQIVRAHPQDADVWIRCAQGAFEAARASQDLGLLARSRTLLEEFAAMDPQHLEVHWMLGQACAALGDAPAAESALRRTLELAPGSVDAGILLAEVLDAAQRKDDARVVLFELLRQPLSSAEVEEVQRRLLALEGE